MATITKTYSTKLDNVVVFADGVRASVSLCDSQDSKNPAAHMVVAVRGGKVVQPALPTELSVDPAVAAASKVILDAFAKIVDQVVAQAPVFIRGSVIPQR